MVCVVGDIHGNVQALLRIFERFGYPPRAQYLFLGDYIDRGRHSCEVIFLLFALKAMHPTCIHLLRGNHEFPEMAAAYGFKDECECRFNSRLYNKVMDSFQHLPVAGVVGFTFCVHGGLSPQLQFWHQISGIEKMPRNANAVNPDNLALVWSDPSPDVGDFAPSPRGCGFLYGEEAVDRFTREGNIEHRIIRAHESCVEGFEWPIPDNESVLTLFSSYDYCQTGNDGAVAVIRDTDLELEVEPFEPILGRLEEKRRVQYPLWMLEPDLKPVEIDLLDDVPDCIEI
jgi:diadenosine tetraphosphatase ApaH/serine/threonine PP2A family protein phosphatase